MESKIRITEGLLLKLLADQSGLSRVKIAESLQITPQWLATVLNENDPLSEEIKVRAAELFNVSPDFFNASDIQSAVGLAVAEPSPGYGIEKSIEVEEARLLAEIARLKDQARVLAERLAEKDRLIEDSKKTIERLFNLLDKKE